MSEGAQRRPAVIRDAKAPAPLKRRDSDRSDHSEDSDNEGANVLESKLSPSLELPPTHDRRHPKHLEDGKVLETSASKFKQNYPFNKKQIPSLLSSESPFHNYRGFLHLAGLILLVSNFRLIVENLLKYGILIKPNVLSSYAQTDIMVWLVALPILCFLILVVQRQAAHNKAFTDNTALVSTVTLLILIIVIPSIVILMSPPAPFSGVVLLMIAVIMWLKMVSYAMANRQFHKDRAAGKEIKEKIYGVDPSEIVQYPQNLTVSNLAYFVCAPTLVYQLNYPRSPRIRWGYVAGKLAQLIFFVLLAIFMIEQWCFPVVKNSFVLIQERKYGGILERVLKLSIPATAIWLSMFYTFFHLWLNIVAEVLKFGDREFYRDWWNATTMGYYWRTWNIPTHNWLVRHVYMPALRHGLSKNVAAALVFLFSAMFHELVISIAIKTFKLYFFVGMALQIPATSLGAQLKGTVLGNLVFWVSFCLLGQPIGVLLYYFDFASTQLAADAAAASTVL